MLVQRKNFDFFSIQLDFFANDGKSSFLIVKVLVISSILIRFLKNQSYLVFEDRNLLFFFLLFIVLIIRKYFVVKPAIVIYFPQKYTCIPETRIN